MLTSGNVKKKIESVFVLIHLQDNIEFMFHLSKLPNNFIMIVNDENGQFVTVLCIREKLRNTIGYKQECFKVKF